MSGAEWVEAGARALDAKWGDVSMPMVRDEAATVVAAVAPLIWAEAYARGYADRRNERDFDPTYPPD